MTQALNNDVLSLQQINDTLAILKLRFEKNKKRHPQLMWSDVEARLLANAQKIWSLFQMEQTGGEPDVVGDDSASGEFHFMDCSAETPAGRRSICYDRAALDARKMHKPHNSAIDMAKEMGVTILNEEQYRVLQQFGPFDTKTSSWLSTPEKIRKLGGALFGDYRYGQVFIYHNGADSYYAVRGFRALLKV